MAELPRSRTVLLTGGRAPVTLELARLFHAAGTRVVVAESLALPLTRGSRAVSRHYRVPSPRLQRAHFASALVDIVRRECVELIVPTCEEVFHVARERERLSPHTRVLVAPFDILRRLHSKVEFMRSAERHGLSVPHTERFTERAALRAFVAARPGEVVLKPEFSRFATRVLVGAEPAAVDTLEVSPAVPWAAQERVRGRPVCSWALAHGGRLAAHAAYGVAYTAGLASTIHFVPERDPRIERWVETFVQAEGFSGQIAFDFMITDDGRVLPLECNPRATSGVHLFGDQPALGDAFFTPPAHVLRPASDAAAMLAVPMLLYGLPRALERGELRGFARDFLTGRDVVYTRHDPLPALAQGLAIVELCGLALRHGRDLLGASTVDIEYNGEDT